MTDGMSHSAIDTIKRVAHDIVREELRHLRGQLQEVCLAAVEAGLGQLIDSERFRRAIKDAAPAGGGASVRDLDARIKAQVTASIPDIVASSETQALLNTLLKDKGKEIFKQAIFGGSLDLKKVVARVVEQSLESRGGLPAAAGGSPPPQASIEAAVQTYITQHLERDIGRVIQTEIKTFLSSELMREMLDSKFRAIDVYLKTDVIPKIVKRELAKAEESRA